MEEYKALEMEVITFDVEDIITTSGDIQTPEVPIPRKS